MRVHRRQTPFTDVTHASCMAFDLGLVMGSSEVMRGHPPHHLGPARTKPRQGETPKRAVATIKPVSQSNLSKIIALLTATMACARSVRIAIQGDGCLLLGPRRRQSV